LKFLGRAKKLFQDLGTEPPARAQSFNVACAGGHRLRGERTEGYQALRCPVCGEGVFVLPRSPLPEPVAPEGVSARKAASRRSRGARADDGPVELTDAPTGDAEIVWDDEPADAAPPDDGPARGRVAPEDLAAAEIDAARRAESAAAARGDRRVASRGAEAGPALPTKARPARSARPRAVASSKAKGAGLDDLDDGFQRATAAKAPSARASTRRGPSIGLIFALLTLLIASTVCWRIWMNRRAQFPLIIERGRVEGIPALDEGDFDRAHQLLSAARSAVDGLGGAVADADEIRQAADEAAVFVDLCPRGLEDLLADAGRGNNPEAWASKFDTLYKGRSFIFDTFIESTPADGGRYEVAYPVLPPGESSRFGDGRFSPPDRMARIDLTGFEAFETAGLKQGAHVTFGARLQAIVYDAGQKEWVVRLEPKSGVFITHQRALLAIGWPQPEAAELPREEQP
jgi:hypothetical protein